MEALLKILKADKSDRRRLINELHNLINSSNALKIFNENEYEFLSEFEMILDQYEPNPECRREDPSFYGDERLEQLINDALEKNKENK